MPNGARLRHARIALLALIGLLLTTPPTTARAGAPTSARDINNLFSDELQQAVPKLKWKGERLSDDTVYAIALTGVSWEVAWGKDHLFTLAWGDCRKAATLGTRGKHDFPDQARELRRLYEARDYRQVVSKATGEFTLDEIGCDANLKEPVGLSLLAMGEPERAFPLLSAPFDPTTCAFNLPAEDRRYREAAWRTAQKAGLTKETIAFALSLLLEPGEDAPNVNVDALQFLDRSGVDVDRVLLGILQAPERLRGLPAYAYAAADLLTYRATPRLLPFLLHLANTDDVYLRSRAVIGLGIVAFEPRPNDPPDWTSKLVLRPLQAFGVSSAERKLIDREIREAAGSDKYRLRSAAAVALALAGDDSVVPQLQRLAKDRAYIVESGSGRSERLLFPVRAAASAGLARYGIAADPGGGDLSGKALQQAKRGGDDKTNERDNTRRDVAGCIRVSPLDFAPTVVTARK